MLFSSYRKNPIVSCITAAFLLLSAVFTFSGCEVEASSKEEAKLISIEIENEPTKTEFTQGEVLDLSGLTVYALYSDSSKKMILDYSVTPAESCELNTTGKITVTVSYKGKTAKFYITVNEKKETDNSPTLTSIEILSLPEKTEYTEGDCFTSNGLVLQGTYSDGTKENLSGWSTNPRNGVELSETGTETVTVTYGNFSKTFTISVKAKPAIISDSFFWGTWVRMDSGEQYEVLESSVKKIGKNSSTSYKITSASGDASGASDTSPSRSRTVLPSEMPYITVETLGTFVKESDSVIKNGDIPYFRNGGTNLDYSLKIVGFSNSRAVSSAVSGLKGTGKSNKFSSFKSEGESGSDGLLKLTAPTINDVQTVTLDLNDGNGGLIIIPDIMVSNNGDYMGTVALVDEDQYNLKISGEISNKDEGYLFGNGAKTYDMTLTITNISENNCSSSVCTIEAADSRLSLSSTEIESLDGFIISTLKENSQKTIGLRLSFGYMTEAYIDTGIKVIIRNSKSKLEWEDYVPLRFYKGMIPITVAAKSPEKNDKAALNGFIIYPDGNNKFFSVKNNESEIVFVPTFGLGEKNRYKIVFSGATVTQELSDSTEMCYSVNPGKSTEKIIDLKAGWQILQNYMDFGGDNQSEDKAYPVESEFIGYLSDGEIDYYTINADSDEFYAPGAKTFHRVTFESEYGTVPSSFLVAEGNYIPSEKLPILEESGMTFEGWYAGSTPVTGNNYPVYGDVTLKASWLKQCSVNYVSEHGTAPVSIIKGETDTFTEEELPVLKADGWFFKGWYASDGSGTTGEKVEADSYVIQGDLTITAKWVQACTISYSSDKAIGDVPAEIIVEKGTVLTEAQLPSLKEKGFRFTGWFIEGTTTKVSVGYSVNSNLNLTAGWEEHYGPDDGFVFVESGTFLMGSESGLGNEKPVHSVTLSDFYISPYELTQGEYEELCCYTSSSPFSSYGYGSQYPVYYVSWYDALVYCNLKSMQEGLTPCYTINGGTDPKNWPGIKTNNGKYSCSYTSTNSTWDAVICDFTADGYRLPTEAEWEFAAKGGKKSQGYTYSGSNTVGDVAWYSNNSGSKTRQVGTKNKNELDLYDMSGNACEWCWDWYGSYSSSSATDPTGASSGSYRVFRGGYCENNDAWYLRVAYRGYDYPYRRVTSTGFRLVRSTKNRIVPCTVSYTNSRGTAPTSAILPKGTALTDAQLPVLSSDNYDFAGWYAGSTKVENGYIIDSDTELEARWNPTSFKITYVLNGGSSGSADEAINDAENPASYTIEDSVTLKPATRTGYKFTGWYKNSSLSGNAVTSIEEGNTGEITLYASWIELCTITYSSEKGLAPEAVTLEKGSLLTKNELPKLKSTGFKMTGWFNGSTKVSVGDKITTSLDLSAHWEEHYGPDDDFVFVEGGTFQMGSESGDSNEKPVHSVTLSDFYISPYELTQGEYEELCFYASRTPSSAYGVGSNYPVYHVSWYDALVYCNLKSMQEGLTPCYTINGTTDPKNWPGIKESNGKYSCSYSSSEDANDNDTWDAVICNFTANGYRLPTEAEWEYAARGGKNSKNYTYSGSDSVDDVAWFTLHPVGTKQENELDLYDMSGNIGELCWDWYNWSSSYTSDSVIDPTGPSSGGGHVCRGGFWNGTATKMRVTCRLNGGSPSKSSYVGGFRLVRSSKNRIVQCTLNYTTARGNAPDSSVVLKGYTFTSEDLPELTYNDYTFDGWYIDGTKVMAGDIVNSDVVLVARWKDNFVFVEGGTFQMGSEDGRDNESPVHSVTISDFYISPYELTQGEYEELCCYTTTPSNDGISRGLQYPVYHVTWYDALVYCNLKSMKEGLTPCYNINGTTDPKNWLGIKDSNGKYSCSYTSAESIWDSAICNFDADGYRLPTEAEWEFAAKGGKKSNGYTYSGGNTVDSVGWYVNNSYVNNYTKVPHEVGTKNKNELDLYDMSGNVGEWCWDWYGSYSSESATNPKGASSGSWRIFRGGCYGDDASRLRVTYRNEHSPYELTKSVGFRLVRSAPKN